LKINISSASGNLNSYLHFLDPYNFEPTDFNIKNNIQIYKEGIIFINDLNELIKLRDNLNSLVINDTFFKNDIILTRNHYDNELKLVIYDTFND
jgi:hypothetical protein